ncbi:hypothetical protein [Bradyrhizobium lablabi]|uniref:hypothetical protein n=1 Tax=Bradyrhizobium lablabi TaxID=722472 RepID=UPI001BAC9267|nr:hypothetical protein [Bradyrhizobium lablabi]MBR0698222.1 hypothetical protein [Bradyrhizobium lablabi]
MSGTEQQGYRIAFAGRDRYNGAILRIGDKVIKLGKDSDSLLLAQEVADRWNMAEPLEAWMQAKAAG